MLSAWDDHAHRTIGIRASHGLSAAQSIQSNGCGSTSTTQSSGFQLFGSVLGSCLGAAHYARIAARYRDQFASAAQTFLSHGVALQNGFSQYLGQRKSSQAVGSLCGFGASFDQNGAYALRQRTVELGVCVADGRDRLRVGFDDDRLVFEHLQLGTVSNYEGSDQASYPDRFEGIDPKFYSHQRWKNARCKSTRYPLRARLYRGWSVLRDGQSVCRLRATLAYAVSTGGELISEKRISHVISLLLKFDAIGAREDHLAYQLLKIGIKNTKWVPDPTVLLDWHLHLNEKFDMRSVRMGIFILNETNYRKIKIGGIPNTKEFFANSHSYDDFSKMFNDPFDWIKRISSVRLLLTDSYHAMLFAVYTNTPFVFLLWGEEHGRDLRITSFLRKIGREGQAVEFIEILTLDPDIANAFRWEDVSHKLDEMRNIAKEFIQSSLKPKNY